MEHARFYILCAVTVTVEIRQSHAPEVLDLLSVLCCLWVCVDFQRFMEVTARRNEQAIAEGLAVEEVE